jgi:transcriptional regulator with GAF, ATPase, and Fis domain
MWESEFFGHRRGAFTGASADRDGLFLLADRGTLFLDEVGAMPLSAQAKLLRALQEGEFNRLGDDQPTRVDVRVVAATNADLDAEIKQGRFRADSLSAERPPDRRARCERPADIRCSPLVRGELASRLPAGAAAH